MQRSMPIDGKRAWTNEHKCQYASNVEEIAFVSGWSELCSPVVDTYQLDRNEAVWQMDREDRNHKQNDCWNTHQRNKGSDQESDATDDLCGDCDPSHQVRQRDSRRLKYAREHFWAPGPFRLAVRQKSITNNQSKEDRRVRRKLRPRLPQS